MKHLTILLLFFTLAIGLSAQTRVMTANDSIQQELKLRLKSAKDQVRLSRTQLKTDEREVTRLTRELERVRRQAQKDKLAARKAKMKGKEYTPKTVKVQMEKEPKARTEKEAKVVVAKETKVHTSNSWQKNSQPYFSRIWTQWCIKPQKMRSKFSKK